VAPTQRDNVAKEVPVIERLQRALARLDDLSPEAQEDLAELIEEQTAVLPDARHEAEPRLPTGDLPDRIRAALAAIGSSRDLQDDDEFTALDRIRHESVPTPPIEYDDL
jgi:hypothetical protein